MEQTGTRGDKLAMDARYLRWCIAQAARTGRSALVGQLAITAQVANGPWPMHLVGPGGESLEFGSLMELVQELDDRGLFERIDLAHLVAQANAKGHGWAKKGFVQCHWVIDTDERTVSLEEPGCDDGRLFYEDGTPLVGMVLPCTFASDEQALQEIWYVLGQGCCSTGFCDQFPSLAIWHKANARLYDVETGAERHW